MVFAPKLLKQPQKCTFVKLTEPVRQNGADLGLFKSCSNFEST